MSISFWRFSLSLKILTFLATTGRRAQRSKLDFQRPNFNNSSRRTFFSHEKLSKRQEKVVRGVWVVQIRCRLHFPAVILVIIIIGITYHMVPFK